MVYCVVDSEDGDLMSLWRTKEHADAAAKSFTQYRMEVREIEMCDTEEQEEEEYLDLLSDIADKERRDRRDAGESL